MDAAAAVSMLGAGGIAVAAAATLLARSPRVAVVGAGAALVLGPVTLSPLPAPLPLAFWLVSALLATYLLIAAVRERADLVAPLPLGGRPEAAFVLLGLVLGAGVAPIAGAGRGTDAAAAASAALAFAALPLAGFSRDPLRAGIGAALTLEAAALLVAALAGTPTPAAVVAFALGILVVGAGSRQLLLLDLRARGLVAADAASPPDPRGGAEPAARRSGG